MAAKALSLRFCFQPKAKLATISTVTLDIYQVSYANYVHEGA